MIKGKKIVIISTIIAITIISIIVLVVIIINKNNRIKGKSECSDISENAEVETEDINEIDLIEETEIEHPEEITQSESTNKTSTNNKSTNNTNEEIGKNETNATNNTNEPSLESFLENEIEETTKNWFISAYNLGKLQYINQINNKIDEKQIKINQLKTEAQNLYTNYMQQVKSINSHYPASESRDIALRNAQENYSMSAQNYTNQISILENEISQLEAETRNPNVDNILSIVSRNNNISSLEAYQYYNKYYK